MTFFGNVSIINPKPGILVTLGILFSTALFPILAIIDMGEHRRIHHTAGRSDCRSMTH